MEKEEIKEIEENFIFLLRVREQQRKNKEKIQLLLSGENPEFFNKKLNKEEKMENKKSVNLCKHESSIKCEECKKILVCNDCEEGTEFHYVGYNNYCNECFEKLGGRTTKQGEDTFEDETELEKEQREKEEREKIYSRYTQEVRHGCLHLILKNGFAYNIEPIEKGREIFDFSGNKTERATTEEIQEDINECEKMSKEEIEEYKSQAKINHLNYLKEELENG